MDFALTVLRIFRKAYEQYFNGTLRECRRLAPIAYRHVETAFTESAFTNLTEAIGKSYGRDNAEAATAEHPQCNSTGAGFVQPRDRPPL